MYKLIWLVPLLPLLGAAINGLLGRKFRFSEKLIGGIAVGSVALAFLISVLAVYSYGFGGNPRWSKPYLTSEEGGLPYSWKWIPGGAVELTEGNRERAHIETMRQIDEAARRRAEELHLQPGQAVLVGVAEAPERRGLGAMLDVEWSYQLDPLSAIFMLVVTGVGLCIFVFATG